MTTISDENELPEHLNSTLSDEEFAKKFPEKERSYVKQANRDATPEPKFVSVLYGDMGSRKTTTAASMVQERGLLLTSDDSWKSLLNDRHRELYSKVKITPLEGFSQFQYINFDGYDTIIWDTLSQSVDSFLDLLYDEAGWSGTNLRQKITTNNAELKKMNLETLAPMDYRVTRDALRPILNRLFRETNAHLVFTSQVREPLPNLSKESKYRPDIPAATFKPVGTRADIIAYTKVNGSKATVDVTSNLTQLGKSRIESIQGNMDQDAFIKAYKEHVFK